MRRQSMHVNEAVAGGNFDLGCLQLRNRTWLVPGRMASSGVNVRKRNRKVMIAISRVGWQKCRPTSSDAFGRSRMDDWQSRMLAAEAKNDDCASGVACSANPNVTIPHGAASYSVTTHNTVFDGQILFF